MKKTFVLRARSRRKGMKTFVPRAAGAGGGGAARLRPRGAPRPWCTGNGPTDVGGAVCSQRGYSSSLPSAPFVSPSTVPFASSLPLARKPRAGA